MYLNPYAAGETLTTAYAIQKMSKGQESLTNEQAKKHTAKVLYDAHKKADRELITFIQNPISDPKNTNIRNYDTGLRSMNFLEAGAIIGAAEKQGEEFKQWARFCYDPDRDGSSWRYAGVWVTEFVHCTWIRETQKKPNKPALEKFNDLAMIASLDSMHLIVTGQHRYSLNEIARMIGYKDAAGANWNKTFAGHWRAMGIIIDKLNAQTLAPVHEKIKCLLGFDKSTMIN